MATDRRTMDERRVALVTGANKGIGFETVRALARRGCCLLLGARDKSLGESAAAKLRDEGLDVRFLQIDVTEAESVASAARIDCSQRPIRFEPIAGHLTRRPLGSLLRSASTPKDAIKRPSIPRLR
jgi:short chain dehydrogenase